jgi:hypothetical protein
MDSIEVEMSGLDRLQPVPENWERTLGYLTISHEVILEEIAILSSSA